MRATVDSKRREIGLGPFPEVSLFEAREAAGKAKDAIRSGTDPVEERKAARMALIEPQKKGLSFWEMLEEHAAKKFPELGTERYRGQWRVTVEEHPLD